MVAAPSKLVPWLKIARSVVTVVASTGRDGADAKLLKPKQRRRGRREIDIVQHRATEGWQP
jgi:hypothetical protein